MTERIIDNRLAKLQAIEAEKKRLEDEAEKIRAEIKADLESKGIEELKTKKFVVRWKVIISSRLDSKALKNDHPDLYEAYTRQSETKRFTYA